MSDEKLKEEREEFRQLMDFNPAFPVTRTFDERALFAYGMSLRDYFAGQAIIGMLAADPHLVKQGIHAGSFPGASHPEDFAACAYGLADAMLAAREPNAPPTDP